MPKKLPERFKYSLYIKQKDLLELSPAITLQEAAVLDYIAGLCLTNNKLIDEQRDSEKYTWIDYGKILREMPILKLESKKPIVKIIKSLEEKSQLIETKNKTVHGRPRKYFKLSNKTKQFIYAHGSAELYRALLEVGMHATQAETLAGDSEFLEDKSNLVINALNSNKIPNKAAYIWHMYNNFWSGFP